MRTLYIECNMGAAGDMLMSALYELMDEKQKEEFLKRMNGLGAARRQHHTPRGSYMRHIRHTYGGNRIWRGRT